VAHRADYFERWVATSTIGRIQAETVDKNLRRGVPDLKIRRKY
jgi:hypothetical protein